jgi:hypothetical protein
MDRPSAGFSRRSSNVTQLHLEAENRRFHHPFQTSGPLGAKNAGYSEANGQARASFLLCQFLLPFYPGNIENISREDQIFCSNSKVLGSLCCQLALENLPIMPYR